MLERLKRYEGAIWFCLGVAILIWSNLEVAVRSPAVWQRSGGGILIGDQTFFFLISAGLTYYLGRTLYRFARRLFRKRLLYGLPLLISSVTLIYYASLGASAAHAARVAALGETRHHPAYLVGYWATSWPFWLGLACLCLALGCLLPRRKKPQP